MSELKREESGMTIELIKKMLRELIYHVDPFEIIEDMEKMGIPLPSFDDFEETEHEFSPEFHEKMAQLFREACGEDYVYFYPVDLLR